MILEKFIRSWIDQSSGVEVVARYTKDCDGRCWVQYEVNGKKEQKQRMWTKDFDDLKDYVERWVR